MLVLLLYVHMYDVVVVVTHGGGCGVGWGVTGPHRAPVMAHRTRNESQGSDQQRRRQSDAPH